jgi:SH3 domain-containing YSC84-like protein 1
MRNTALLFLAGALLAGQALAVTKSAAPTRKDIRVLDNATQILDKLTQASDNGIPRDLLDRAECVLVFPHVTKAAFFVGGRFGRGVAVCRNDNDQFGAPAFMSLGGPSIGWQWGGQRTDFVMLVMNKEGIEHLLDDRFTIGGEASVAAGPVGRTAGASTDAQFHAQILTWSRSRGLFAGASLEGASIQSSQDANERMYGEPKSVREILTTHVAVPEEGREFVDFVAQLGSRPNERAQNEQEEQR